MIDFSITFLVTLVVVAHDSVLGGSFKPWVPPSNVRPENYMYLTVYVGYTDANANSKARFQDRVHYLPSKYGSQSPTDDQIEDLVYKAAGHTGKLRDLRKEHPIYESLPSGQVLMKGRSFKDLYNSSQMIVN